MPIRTVKSLEGYKKICVCIPETDYKDLLRVGVDRDITLSDIIRELITEYLDGVRNGAVKDTNDK